MQGILETAMGVVVVVSSFWVFTDCRDRTEASGQKTGPLGPVGWLVGCGLLWVAFFPWYLMERSSWRSALDSPQAPPEDGPQDGASPVPEPSFLERLGSIRLFGTVPRQPFTFMTMGVVVLALTFSAFSGSPRVQTGAGVPVILGLASMMVGLLLVGLGMYQTRLRWLRWVFPTRDWSLGQFLLAFYVIWPVAGFVGVLVLMVPVGGVVWVVDRVGIPAGTCLCVALLVAVWMVEHLTPIAGLIAEPKAPVKYGPGADPGSSESPPKVCPGCGHVYAGAARFALTCRECDAPLPNSDPPSTTARGLGHTGDARPSRAL